KKRPWVFNFSESEKSAKRRRKNPKYLEGDLGNPLVCAGDFPGFPILSKENVIVQGVHPSKVSGSLPPAKNKPLAPI
ncbi:MAG: hypothetical protein V3S29_05635, partial [bacterium]